MSKVSFEFTSGSDKDRLLKYFRENSSMIKNKLQSFGISNPIFIEVTEDKAVIAGSYDFSTDFASADDYLYDLKDLIGLDPEYYLSITEKTGNAILEIFKDQIERF